MSLPFNRVSDVMTTSPFWVSPDETVDRASGRLLRESHSGCPVCDNDGAVVGVLSELDLVRALLPATDGSIPSGIVGDYMTKAPVMLQPDMGLRAAAEFFMDVPVRRAPIVDAAGKLLGVCSRRDVLRALDANARALRCED